MDAGASLVKYVGKYISRTLLVWFGLQFCAAVAASERPEPATSHLETSRSHTGIAVTRISGIAGTTITAESTDWKWGQQVRHQYSKLSPWNCDQSFMMLLNRGGKPGTLILDGKSYRPTAFTPDFWYQEMRWHPRKPDQLIYARANEVGIWHLREARREVLTTFEEHDKLYFGPWEGNPSDDGQWMVIAAGKEPVDAIFAFNLETKEKRRTIEHGFTSVDFATISPSGKYIVVNGVRTLGQPDRTAVFNIGDGSLVRRWDEFGLPSHFDLDLSANSREVAIGVAKSGPFEGSLIERDLVSGKIRSLKTPGYGIHTSARNIAGGLRVVGSFSGIGDSENQGSDIIATVGTGQKNRFEPIARPRPGSTWNYWAQSQPVISPLGNKIVWASATGNDETVGTFIAEIESDPSVPTKLGCKP